MTSAHMHRALSLARRGLGTTSPNPMVGAVIVNATGDIVGEGYHKKAGGPHAEVVALRKAGDQARGNILYVTLEPCNHQGRTPACTDAIIQSGITKVVIATRDPNPHVKGGGIEKLMQAGIEVTVGDGKAEADELNRAFNTWSRFHRPLVTLKAAMTLDGKIASVEGESKYLTSTSALHHAHELRRTHDAILVGSNTVIADNPRLTYRGSKKGTNPVRIVLDGRGRIAADALIFDDPTESPTLIFTSPDSSIAWEREIFSAGGEVIRVHRTPSGHLDLKEMLAHLFERHILSLLVEGGPSVHASFLEQHVVDEWVGYVAPLILGGQGAPSPVGGNGFSLPHAHHLTIHRVARRGPDVIIEARYQGQDARDAHSSDAEHIEKEGYHVYGSH